MDSQETNDIELVDNQIVIIANKISELETKLKEFKELEKEYDDFKSKMLEAMNTRDIKKFTSPEGIQFTAVSGTPEKTELKVQFNESKFKEDYVDLYKEYSEITEKVTNARASYLKINIPKKEEN